MEWKTFSAGKNQDDVHFKDQIQTLLIQKML